MDGFVWLRRVLVASLAPALVAVVAFPLLSDVAGWSPGRSWSSGGLSGLAFRPAVSAGRPLTVRLSSVLSSASARAGDRWIGVVVRPVAVGSRFVIHAGTRVRGVVTGARDARSGEPAKLELAIQDFWIGGASRPLAAMTGSFVAARGPGDDVVLKPRTVMVFRLDPRIAMR